MAAKTVPIATKSSDQDLGSLSNTQRNTGILVGVVAAVAGVAVTFYLLNQQRKTDEGVAHADSVADLLDKCHDTMQSLQSDVEQLTATA